MAKEKKSFVLYNDQLELFNALSNEQAGELIKHIFQFINNNEIELNDPLLKIAFVPIKQQLIRDLEKYQNVVERNRLNGQKGGRPNKPKKPNGLIGNPKEPKKPDNDNDNDNDNGNDIINNKSKVNFDSLLEHFNQSFKKRCFVFSEKVKKQYLARINEGYNLDQIKLAMVNASKDEFHQSNGFKHCTLEFFSRPDKIDKFAFTTEKRNVNQYIPTK